MSLSKEAIVRIEELSASSSDLPDTDFKKVALPSNVSIHNLELFQKYRNHFRGDYNTTSIEEYIRFVNIEDDTHNPICFVDEQKMTAKTIFDFGDKENPGHAFHKAHLSLLQTRPYSKLNYANGLAMSQIEAIEWIEDWMHVLKGLNNDNEHIDIKKALGAIRRVEISESKNTEHESQQFLGKKSMMESIAVKGTDDNLPSFLVFKTEPYLNFKEREFKLRVSVLTAKNEIGFKFSIIQLDKIQEEIAEEFKKKIQSDIENIPVYLGNFDSK